MAKCVFEHCDNEGGRLKFNFTATKETYETTASVCQGCYDKLRSVKGNTGKMPICNIKFSVVSHAVAFEGMHPVASVKSMRMEGHNE